MYPHHLKIRKLLRWNVRPPEVGPIRSGRVIVSQVMTAGRLGCAAINRGGYRLSLADETPKCNRERGLVRVFAAARLNQGFRIGSLTPAHGAPANDHPTLARLIINDSQTPPWDNRDGSARFPPNEFCGRIPDYLLPILV
jgi:hypothetical protein